VFGRQTPGLQTTVQLAESAIKGFDSLKETVEQFEIKKEERKTMKDELSGKASITTVQTVPWDQRETTSTPPIVEAKIPTQTPQKEPIITEPKPVEAKLTPSVKEGLKIAEPCSPKVKACVDDLVAKGTPEEHAWPICKAQFGETAELKPLSPTEKLELTEQKGLSFDERQKQGEPEELSALGIKRDRIANENNQKIVKAVNIMSDQLPIVHANLVEIQVQSHREITSVVEQTNTVLGKIELLIDDHSKEVKALQESHKALQESHKSLAETTVKKADLEPIMNALAENKTAIANSPKDDLTWKETIATLATDDLSWKEELLKKADAESVTKELTEAKATIAKTTENLAKLEETVATVRKDNEEIVKAAKVANAENKKLIGEMETEHTHKIAEKDKELGELKQKQIETDKKLQETAVRTDNLEDKQKGTFKGQNKQLEPETTTHTKPEDDMRKTAQRRN
jgi:hypothetical protein